MTPRQADAAKTTQYAQPTPCLISPGRPDTVLCLMSSGHTAHNGCPGKPTRLMVGLQYPCVWVSDEAVVSGWVENPY